jgi:DMSO/TMAO reductase YedYZ molybdopterin-dependent catalytic subunit
MPFVMRSMNRRRFMKYGVGSVILGALGLLSGYFFTRGPEQLSSTISTSGTGRLPPGQSEVEFLEVFSTDGVPEIKLDDWVFDVNGEVQNPFKLSWSRFQQLPKTMSDSGFHCVTGWTRLHNSWEGVRFTEIATVAKPTAKAKYATIECYGNAFTPGEGPTTYTTSLPLKDLLRNEVLFAYGLDGKMLEAQHGGPLRLVVPQKYGYKSAKWVKRVKFTETQELGFWERQGYSNTADPWTNDRYAPP